MESPNVILEPTEEAKEKICELLKETSENKKEYSYADILEMFDGGSHMEPEQLKYIYHFLKGDVEQSKYYLEICLKNAHELATKCQNMVDAKETNFYKY